MIRVDGEDIKEGQFSQGKLSGFGREIWFVGCYVGEFKSGIWHGQGTLIDTDISSYVGSFSEGWKHGLGIFTEEDGSVFEGEWV